MAYRMRNPVAEGYRRPRDLIPYLDSQGWRHTRQMKLFDDRGDAADQLAQRLRYQQAVVVLGLPRRGTGGWGHLSHCKRHSTSWSCASSVPFQPELARRHR